MAAAKASTHAVWLKKLLEEMKFKQIEPTKIFHDNKSTISLSKILFLCGRSKHTHIRYREWVRTRR